MKMTTAMLLVIVLSGVQALTAAENGARNNTVPQGNDEIQFLASIKYPGYIMPALDPEFVKWDDLWYQWVKANGEAHFLRHRRMFYETAPKLNLSREQLEKLLPLVQTTRNRFRQRLDLALVAHDKAMRADRSFLPDDIAEDLLDKGPDKKKDAPGNFDKRAWDLMISQVHGPLWSADDNGNFDWKVIGEYKKGLAEHLKALNEVFTPEQLKLMESRDVGTRSLFWCWDEQAFTDSFIIFSAPGAEAWVAKQLGKAPPAEEKMGEELEKVVRHAVLRRNFHRHFRLTASPLHYLKGSRLNLAQLEKLEQEIKTLIPAHIIQIQTDLDGARAYVKASAQIVACLEAGKPVPAELQQTARKSGECVGWGVWHVCDITPWTYPGQSKEFTAARDKMVQDMEVMLLDTQRIVLYDAATCFIPWFTFTDPVNAGAPKKGSYDIGNENLNNLRFAKDDKAAKLVDQLVSRSEQGFDAKAKDRKTYPLLAATKDAEKERVAGVVEKARKTSDVDFELNRQAVADEYEGKQYSSVIHGFGLPNLSGPMPERDGIWPKIDWSNAEVQRKWKGKLSFYGFPTVLQIVQIRIALTKQFKPRPATDLEKLPGVAVDK